MTWTRERHEAARRRIAAYRPGFGQWHADLDLLAALDEIERLRTLLRAEHGDCGGEGCAVCAGLEAD